MVMGTLREEAELAIVGGGPGGYVAAIRAADLGREVVLIDERSRLGGVCLLEGCIPSKALIHATGLIDAAREAKAIGLEFAPPKLDLAVLRQFVHGVIGGLSKGVDGLLAKRGVEVIHGRVRFTGPHTLLVEGEHQSTIEFRNVIVATGSRPARIPAAGELPVWTSTEALGIPEVPPRLIVVGGGYIGLELGQVYAALGAQVTIVEFAPRMLPGADPDLVDVVVRRARQAFAGMLVESKVVGMERTAAGLAVAVEHEGSRRTVEAERVLVAAGRAPNTDALGLEALGVALDKRGFVQIDEYMRTNVPNIYAIGDLTGKAMFAHVASAMGMVAAEHAGGCETKPIKESDYVFMPRCVYCEPQVASLGMTEAQAKEQGREIKVGKFPFQANGKALGLGDREGFVKIIADARYGEILGAHLVGPDVTELLPELELARTWELTTEEIARSVHAHPTLSEALMEAAHEVEGHSVQI